MRATSIPGRTLLSRQQWLEMGVSSRRLAGPQMVTVFPGFQTSAASPATVNEMCHVLQARVQQGAVISHTTAAALIGLPVPWWVDGGIGLLGGAAYRDGSGVVIPSTLPIRPPEQRDRRLTPRAGADSRRPGRARADAPSFHSGSLLVPPTAEKPLVTPPVLHARVPGRSGRTAGERAVIHRLLPAPSFILHGLRVSHPFIVLLELATMLDHDEVVVAVDRLVGRKPPFRDVTLEDVTAAVESNQGRDGVPALRRALRDARANSASPGETRTRLLLRRAGFPEPVLNPPVPVPDFDEVRYIDLAYPELMIGVEYQGDGHRVTRGQWRDDQARRDSLASAGWNLRYLTADDIAAPARFLSALRRAFVQAGASAPPESNWTGRAAAQLSRPRRG